MVLLITDQDIQKVPLTPEEAIAAVENCYLQDGHGHAHETPRIELRVKGRDLPHIAPGTTSVGMGGAYLEETGLLVYSESYHFDFHKYMSKILDPESGRTLAVIKRGRAPFGTKAKQVTSGNLRTGAAAAVGVKYLANKEVENLGVIGTGRIGSGSLLCVSKVRDFTNVYVHSGRKTDPEFAEKMSRLTGLNVIAADSVEQAVKKSDVLVTATYASEPLVKGEWLREGCHISGMGSDGPMKAENDPTVFNRAGKIFVDSEKCLSIKELARPLSEGLLSMSAITGRIGELVAGHKPGRESSGEITFFESDGTHMQSASIVGAIYKKVLEAGLGVETDDINGFFYNP